MLLHGMVYHQEQLTSVLPQTSSKAEISSPHSARELVFHETEIFPGTHQNNSEVASSSNGLNEEYSSKPTHFSLTSEMNLYKDIFETNTSNTTISSVLNMNNNYNESTNNLSLVFDSPGVIEQAIDIASDNNSNNKQEDVDNLSLVFGSPRNDIVFTSIDFNQSTNYTTPLLLNNQQDQQFDLTSLNNQIFHREIDIITNNSINQQFHNNPSPPVIPLMTSSVLPHSFEDESLARVPSYYTQMNTTTHSCSLINSGLGTNMSTAFPLGDFNFQVDNSIGNNFPCTVPLVYDFNYDIQALTNENQQLIKGHSNSTPLPLERASNFDESSVVTVGKLSVEEKKEKIKRYMKKRNERNFNKKIKYVCRKTLADSRPRVRGRFAKNDDLIEAAMAAMMNHAEGTHEDSQLVVLRDEDFIVSTDFLAQLDGLKTFNCKNALNPIQTWI